MAKWKPKGCIAKKVNSRTVILRGVPISLNMIARSQGIDHSYLSRILSGDRDNVKIPHYRKIAAALGGTLQQVIEAIEENAEQIRSRAQGIKKQHLDRLVREEDAGHLKSVPAIPSAEETMPEFRQPERQKR